MKKIIDLSEKYLNKLDKNAIKSLFYILPILIFSGLLFQFQYLRSTEIETDFYQTYYVAKIFKDGLGLYTRYHYFFGVFTPVVHSWIITIFSERFEVLYWLSFLIINSCAILIYVILNKLTNNKIFSSLFSFFFLVVCAYQNVDSYAANNFLTPYNWASIYTILFGLILYLNFFKEQKRNKWIDTLLIFFIAINRFEYGLMAVVFCLYYEIKNKNPYLKTFIYYLVAPVILFFLSYSYYINEMGFSKFFLENIIWPPHIPFMTPIIGYKKNLLGFNLNNLLNLGIGCFLTTVILFVNPKGQLQKLLYFIFILITCIVLIFTKTNNLSLFIPASVIVIGIGIYLKNRTTNTLIAVLFSTLFIIRIFFNSTIGSYFFYMGIPSLMIFFYFAWQLINKNTIKTFAFYLLTVLFIFKVLMQTSNVISLYNVEFETPKKGKLFIKNNPIQNCYNTISHLIHDTLKKQDTILLIPESPIFNYIYDMPQLLPYNHINPEAYFYYGPNEIIKEVAQASPNFIFATQFYAPNFAPYELFGIDYGSELMNWIKSKYDVIGRCGANTNLRSYGSGNIEIYRRK